MGRKGSLGLILEVNQPFLDLFPSNSFQMYTFYLSLFIFLPLSSSLHPLQSPFSSPSHLRKSFTCLQSRVVFFFFFKAIDPQPSASINPALSVWSLRQIYPYSPEFTLWLCFITNAVDNQYELRRECLGSKNIICLNTPSSLSLKRTVDHVSFKDKAIIIGKRYLYNKQEIPTIYTL